MAEQASVRVLATLAAGLSEATRPGLQGSEHEVGGRGRKAEQVQFSETSVYELCTVCTHVWPASIMPAWRGPGYIPRGAPSRQAADTAGQQVGVGGRKGHLQADCIII